MKMNENDRISLTIIDGKRIVVAKRNRSGKWIKQKVILIEDMPDTENVDVKIYSLDMEGGVNAR